MGKDEQYATQMTHSQVVSGRGDTLQCFDFIAQTLEQMLKNEYVDRVLLCSLLATLAQNKQFELLPNDGVQLAEKPL